MTEKINIAEILKDCPKGMELYSPLCGKCVFDRLNFGTIICKKQNTQEITFTSKGYYMLPVFDDCECMIFPSKDQRDWSKFVPPCKFKDGDIVYVKTINHHEYILIFKEIKNDQIHKYVCFTYQRLSIDKCPVCQLVDAEIMRLATEEEKHILFDSIKANGYRWNEETKSLEKLVEPKFKDGDRVVKKGDISIPVSIVRVGDKYYYHYSYTEGTIGLLPIAEQDDWELFTNKFDINTLKTFDKVLMRSSNAREWVATFYSHYSNNKFYGCGMCCDQCIPYEGNQHLLGTTNDCNEYFKTWEE